MTALCNLLRFSYMDFQGYIKRKWLVTYNGKINGVTRVRGLNKKISFNKAYAQDFGFGKNGINLKSFDLLNLCGIGGSYNSGPSV